MKGYLLDVNLLLALGWEDHLHHGVARQWFRSHRSKGWATCGITQLSFIRISSHPRFTTPPAAPAEARALLLEIVGLPGHHFWDEPSRFATTRECDSLFEKVHAHALVTDAYLVAIAKRHGGMLATFDQQMKTVFGDFVELVALD